MTGPSDDVMLHRVKVLHTLAWAFFVCCIAGVYVAAWMRDWPWAFGCIAIVAVEVGILALNAWRCPLTAVAERYTPDREPNADIYLPRWLAQYNKEIFGSLYVGGVAYALYRWIGYSA